MKRDGDQNLTLLEELQMFCTLTFFPQPFFTSLNILNKGYLPI